MRLLAGPLAALLPEEPRERLALRHGVDAAAWSALVGVLELFGAGIGRWLDRTGSRIVLTTIVAALGVIVIMMSRATGLTMLLVCVTLTRGLGQSSLSVVSLAMVGKWFRRRLTRAMAVYAVAMSVGFMLAFPIVGGLVLTAGWRNAWAAVGVFLVAVVGPLA